MKKELKENSFPTPRITVEQAIESGTVMQYISETGWQAGKSTDSYTWRWMRRYCVLDDWNYLTFRDLSERAVSQFRQYYNSHTMPGSASNVGIPVEGYNMFATWDLWDGGYVANLGYVGAPTSSQEYGASLYLSSWAAQGYPDTPLPNVKFYKLQEAKKWRGGYVSNWGYVEQNRHVLGATTSIWFYKTYSESERPLANLINFHLLLYSNEASMTALKKRFEEYWNKTTNSYEIDDQALNRYLQSQYYQATYRNIPDALAKHYGVIIRVVTRTDSSYGRKYGKDYLVIAYNPFLRTYMYFDPITGKLGSLDAAPIESGQVETVNFVYYR